MLPLRDENPVQTTPVVTWLIVAACIAAYLLWQPGPFGSASADVEFNLRHAAVPCEIVQGRPLNVDEVIATFNRGDDEACGVGTPTSPAFDPGKNVFLALFTSMFLHGSLFHIGGNLLFLWIFGNNVEDRLGKIAFAAFYLVGGVVAALSHTLLSPDSTVPVVGASGAIAAVMGAYLVWFPNVRVRTAVIFFFITVIDVRAKWVLGFWFLLQFFTNPNESVAWVAHVGGFVFGVIIGWLLRDRGTGPRGGLPPPPQGDPWGRRGAPAWPPQEPRTRWP